jgi:hypothetical protein
METENNIMNLSQNSHFSYSTQNANEYSGIYCFTYKSNRQNDTYKNFIKIGKFTMPNPLDINDNEN